MCNSPYSSSKLDVRVKFLNDSLHEQLALKSKCQPLLAILFMYWSETEEKIFRSYLDVHIFCLSSFQNLNVPSHHTIC